MIATLILALYLLELVPAGTAVTFLYVTGISLIIAEFIVMTFGVLAFNGAIALIVALAIQTGENAFLGISIDWSLLFGVAFVEILVVVISVLIILHYRKVKVTTGTEGMVGQKAVVVKWKGTSGQVRIQGEIWKAKSDTTMNLSKDENVTVADVDDLVLKVTN